MQSQLSKYASTNPNKFWLDAALDLVSWTTPPTIAYQPSSPDQGSETGAKWFPNAQLNTCYNALDRHITGASAIPNQPALVYESPITNTPCKVFTFSQLLDHVKVLSKVLTDRLGVKKGDCVVIYMSLVPESVMAMLACSRIGAIHSVVFGGFASGELAKRIDDCKPVAILTTSCGIEPGPRIIRHKPLVDHALQLTRHRPNHVMVLHRQQQGNRDVLNRDAGEVDWMEEVERVREKGGKMPDPVVMSSDDPLYVLYTSGSTGKPKGVVRDNGGHAVCVSWAMRHVFGLEKGDVMFSSSDIGWVVGHSFIVYGPLIHGCTTVLYEGKPIGPPDAGVIWRVIRDHGVNVFFTSPTALRAIKRVDPDARFMKQCKMRSLKHVFAGGERLDTNTIEFFEHALDADVRDHYWQTESGWPITAACIMPGGGKNSTKVKMGAAGKVVPGYNVRVLVSIDEDDPNPRQKNETHKHAKVQVGSGAKRDESLVIDKRTGKMFREGKVGEVGNLVVKKPLPPGCFVGLYRRPGGIEEVYGRYEGYFDLMDEGVIDADGYVTVMSRMDDVMNVAGHRLGSGMLEEAVCHHAKIAECAVVGQKCLLKGERPFAFVVLKYADGSTLNSRSNSDDLFKEVDQFVRKSVGGIGGLVGMSVVRRLPKTRSGKILRRVLRGLLHGERIGTIGTIEDEDVIAEIANQLHRVKL